MIHFVFFTWIF